MTTYAARTDVSAELQWDNFTQTWEPSPPFDDPICNDCGGIRNDEWVMLPAGESAAPKPRRCTHTMEMFQ